MAKSVQNWLRISLLNLLIVSFIGILLRYKIAFSFPLIDQKHLLHGHSHFAFTGWISQVLMTLLIWVHSKNLGKNLLLKYQWLLYLNLITAYGMLIAFTIQGYGVYSITFSTISIINSFVFGFVFWKDLNACKHQLNSFMWYKAAIIFNIISSLGAFGLSFLMINFSSNQNYYLLAVYFYLHFQYNGWFFFTIMGLFVAQIEKIESINKKIKIIFWIFASACLPAYFLSALWLTIPIAGYAIIILAAIGQCVSWGILLKSIFENKVAFKTIYTKQSHWLFSLAAIAFSIKIFLQLFSTLPALSQWAFGFRPIVIGYLHLMFLGVITIFILGFIRSASFFQLNASIKFGTTLFVVGIVLNQLMLMIQGMEAMIYIGIPFMNELLFIAAIIMFIGLFFLNTGSIKKNNFTIIDVIK